MVPHILPKSCSHSPESGFDTTVVPFNNPIGPRMGRGDKLLSNSKGLQIISELTTEFGAPIAPYSIGDTKSAYNLGMKPTHKCTRVLPKYGSGFDPFTICANSDDKVGFARLTCGLQLDHYVYAPQPKGPSVFCTWKDIRRGFKTGALNLNSNSRCADSYTIPT